MSPANPLENLSRPGGSLTLGEYEGLLEVDERLVKDLILAAQRVADALAAA